MVRWMDAGQSRVRVLEWMASPRDETCPCPSAYSALGTKEHAYTVPGSWEEYYSIGAISQAPAVQKKQ